LNELLLWKLNIKSY